MFPLDTHPETSEKICAACYKAATRRGESAWTKPVITVYPPAPDIPKPWEREEADNDET